MDSYRSEHEKTIAGKDKVIENFKLQMQQNAKHKVSVNQLFFNNLEYDTDSNV